MPGTKLGAAKAAKTNKERYGDDFYKRIGTVGGTNGKTGGFSHEISCNCDIIREPHYVKNCAGRKGGFISRRRPRVGV